MHVVKVLHKQLQKTGSIHKKRLESLFDIVETAMQTQYVTLTGLAGIETAMQTQYVTLTGLAGIRVRSCFLLFFQPV